MLIVEHREKNEKRTIEALLDEDSGRTFTLTFFAVGASKGGDDVDVMVYGLAGNYHADEYRPNGRLLTSNRKRYVDVDPKEWAVAGGVPSKAYAKVAAVKAANPGYEIVSVGSGRGCRSIYYPTRKKAIRAIENALLSDVWLMDREPIRCRKLGRKAQISLEDYSALSKTPGQERIMQALGCVEKLVKKGQKVEVSTHLDKFRIEVRQPGLEYPDSMRMLVSFAANGRPDGFCFARQGFYGVADALMGSQVPRYDQAEGVATGIPGYGQGFYQSVRPRLGWRLEECLGYQDGSSDKIYAHVRSPDGRSYVTWGRREGPSLQVKNMGTFEAQDAVRSKYGRYSPIDVSSIPKFWDRVVLAVSKK
jgi:hypothetical protein